MENPEEQIQEMNYTQVPLLEDKKLQNQNKCMRLIFNIFVGQCIAIGMVSGGIFTKRLGEMGLNTPLLQLTIMYIPLSFYLIYHL